MTTRRSFLKWLAGAVIAATVARQVGAKELPEIEEPKPDALYEQFTWIEDPFPVRLRQALPGEESMQLFPGWVEVHPYIQGGRLLERGYEWTAPNPDYKNAPSEVRIRVTPHPDSCKSQFEAVLVER